MIAVGTAVAGGPYRDHRLVLRNTGHKCFVARLISEAKRARCCYCCPIIIWPEKSPEANHVVERVVLVPLQLVREGYSRAFKR